MDTKVFLVHCREPSVDLARRKLLEADGCGTTWDLVEIENVAPMDAAFNRMLELADTDFHVQVDADMHVKPHAIESLRNAITHAPDETWQICFPIWDTLFLRSILGIKIYRSPLARRYPYRPTRSCERDQYLRAERDGYAVSRVGAELPENASDVLAWHVVPDNRTAFWNCFDRAMRSRVKTGFAWLDPYYAEFWRRWRQTEDDRFLYGLFGLVSGLASAVPKDWGEKDYRRPPAHYQRFDALRGTLVSELQGIRQTIGDPSATRRFVEELFSWVEGLVPDDAGRAEAIQRLREKLNGGRPPTNGTVRSSSVPSAARSTPRDPGPKELIVYLTSRCNAKCPFCALTLGKTPTVPDVTPELVERVLARYPSAESACIAGFGEPTVSAELYPVADKLLEKGKTISLITNGVLLRKHVERLAERQWIYINVSLNAAAQEEHAERMHIRDMFETVQLGIRKAVAASLPIGVSFVVGRANVDRVPDYLSLAHELNVTFVNLMNTLPHGGPQDELILTTADSDVVDFLAELRSSDHPGVSLVRSWPVPIDDTPPWNCQSPFVSLGVDGRGALSPCRRILAPEPEYGMLEHDGFYASHFELLRSAMRDKRPHELAEPCQKCFGNWRG
jgi:MoaA/NifB/PqqE/SkfB family radical SAM enzyme